MNWHKGLLRDVHYACRGVLAQRITFTTIGILLSLGVGATTAMFTLVNTLSFQALRVSNPNQLVIVQRHIEQLNINATAFNYAVYRELNARTRSFAGLLARWPLTVDVTVDSVTRRMRAELVSGNYFRTLSLSPAMGRLLTEDDDGLEGSAAVCVISHQMWRDDFGSDPHMLQRLILIDGVQFRIVGVAPPTFTGTALHEATNLYVPTSMTKAVLPNSSRDTIRWSWLGILGRVKAGTSIEEAGAELRVIGSQLVEEGLTPPAPSGANPWHLASAPQGFNREGEQLVRPALLLLGGAALLLLITCFNVAGLLISSMNGRRHELAVRLILGSSRWRVSRMLMMESAIGGVVTLIAGSGVAVILTRLFTAYAQNYRPGLLLNINPDLRTLSFVVGLTFVVVLAVGVVPTLYVGRSPTMAYLRSGRGISRQTRRVWRTLLTAQVGFSVVLLFSAGLLSRTVYHLRSAPLGIDLDDLTLLSISPSKAGYSGEDAQRLVESVLSRLEMAPTISAASFSTIGVLSGEMFAIDVTVPGHIAHGEEANNYVNATSPGYFRTLGIPLLDGRDFNSADISNSAKVAIVNRSFSNHYWQGRSPIGQWFERGKSKIEIVGLVGDAKYNTLRDSEPPVIYFPLAQQSFDTLVAHIRSDLGPTELAGIVQQVLNENAQNVSIFGVTTMRSQRNALMATESLIGWLSILFAAAAALLSAIGVYGLVSSLTIARQKEIAIRAALGSPSSNIARMFMWDGILVVTYGLLIGVPLSMYVSGIFRSILFEVEPFDPSTLACVTAISCLSVFSAMMLPTLRVLRLDPAVILRHE